MNVRGGQGVVVDGDVGDFPFVIRVSKHAAINKKTWRSRQLITTATYTNFNEVSKYWLYATKLHPVPYKSEMTRSMLFSR